MPVSTPSIVPANRLGQLLAEARLRTGADLEELASRGEFTVGELSDLEAGHRLLNDTLVSEVTKLYEIDFGPIVPQRAELTIDMTDKMMSAAGQAVPIASTAHNHILERYLSLVYLLRDRDPGSEVPLRTEDLDILAASLAERRELIEEQLLAAMEPDRESVRGLVGWFKQRLWVPGAGAIVGAVSVGTLVMASPPTDAAADGVSEPEPEPNRNVLGNLAGSLRLSTPSSSSMPAPEVSTFTVTNPPTSIDSTSSTTEAALVAPDAVGISESAGSTAEQAATNTTSPELMGQQAEALLPFEWQQLLPEWEINYRGEDSRFRGLTYPYDKSIDMFVRDSDTPESLAGILAHELGHAVDVEHFNDGQRNQWRQSRGISEAPWWPDAYSRDFETGAGDFAESFAYWAVADESSSELGPNPNAQQLALIEEFVASL